MASEGTVVSDHSTAPEQVEKVNEEVKKVEPEGLLPPSKGRGDEDKLKAEELQSQPAPSPEPEEKMEDKPVESSLPKELEKIVDTQASDVPVQDKPETPGIPEGLLPPSKGGGDEDKLKAEELQSQPAPSSESEEKMEDKPVESSLPKELEKIVDTQASDVPVQDKPEAPGILEPVTDITKSPPEDQASTESVEKQPLEDAPKVEDYDVPKPWKSQPEEQPAIVSVEKQPLAPAAEAVEKMEEQVLKMGDTLEPTAEAVEKQLEEAPKLAVPEPSVVADHAKSQLEEQLTPESVEKQLQEQPLVEAVEKKTEEPPPKIGDAPQPLVEAVEKMEDKVEVLPVKESEGQPIMEKIPEPVPEVAEKVDKQGAGAEPEEISKADIVKVEEALDDKIKYPKEEPAVIESLGQITSTNVEAQVDIEGDGGKCPPTVVPENANAAVKELSGTNAVEESRKVEKEVTEESNEPITHKAEEVSSISPIEVGEKSFEEDITSSRDNEPTAGKESMKDETVTSVETEKNGEVKEKVDEVAETTTTTKEQVEEPQKLETEVKGEETVQTDEPNLVKEKEAGEITKPDVPTRESTKEGDDTKTSKEPPKEEVISSKPTKHSNNIVAKVKQTLVKAKKAIIGKSHKTVSSETKGGLKDK